MIICENVGIWKKVFASARRAGLRRRWEVEWPVREDLERILTETWSIGWGAGAERATKNVDKALRYQWKSRCGSGWWGRWRIAAVEVDGLEWEKLESILTSGGAWAGGPVWSRVVRTLTSGWVEIEKPEQGVLIRMMENGWSTGR